MLSQKSKQKEWVPKNQADKRIAELRSRIEKILERTRRIEAELACREEELLRKERRHMSRYAV